MSLSDFSKSNVFTPGPICQLMSSKLHSSGSLLDPCVGTGNLLKFLDLSRYGKIDVYDIQKKYLNKITDKNINKFNLDFLKSNLSQKYKNIILNPPYIKVQDLPIEYREFLRNKFYLLNKGAVDIYYAFILKCLNQLRDDGRMVCITPNSYFYNKSALPLRRYLLQNQYIQEIIDFGTEKVFTNTSIYCCITIFTKTPKDFIIYNGRKIKMEDITPPIYNIFQIKTDSKQTLRNLCKIRNGLATLRDKIYIHDQKLYDEPCWRPITNAKDIKYIIYPYSKIGKVMDEEQFKKVNPQTYEYLLPYKEELGQRDKGKKIYPEWYSYGRTQSLVPSQKKEVIYLPSFANPDKLKFHISPPLLFYSCLCIEPYNTDDIGKIKNTILQNIDVLKSLSSKRAGGWITLSSRNIYQLPLIT